jgi:hypothetical protein
MYMMEIVDEQLHLGDLYHSSCRSTNGAVLVVLGVPQSYWLVITRQIIRRSLVPPIVWHQSQVHEHADQKTSMLTDMLPVINQSLASSIIINHASIMEKIALTCACVKCSVRA